ncbi:MAG: hypothetical protein P8I55_08330 [Crocinitomix sp.]|nr:hypothetical protein [Crocinitomix sp.]
MRTLLIIICAFLFANCQGDSKTDEVTGILMEVEPSQAELDEISLEQQPQTIQDFFAVETNIIGNDFCYDYSSISQLILYGNDSTDEWRRFEVSENYLTAYHKECNVLLEFMTFELGGEKKAFVCQTNRENQQFDYLSWNSKTDRWIKVNRYPQPSLTDYFNILEWSDEQLVHDYGSDNVYINPKTTGVTFVFSKNAMLLNMGEKQQLEFTQTPDYYYELSTNETELTLNQVPIHPNEQVISSYIIACSILESPSEVFSTQYETLLSEIADESIGHQMTRYGANDSKVYFPTDTIELSDALLNEPVDAFWLFDANKAPFIIAANQDIDVIVQQAKAYFESED